VSKLPIKFQVSLMI